MKFTLITILLLLFVTFDSCIPMDIDYGTLATIRIENNSDDSIGYWYNQDRGIVDTILPEIKPNFDVTINKWGIKPYSFKTRDLHGSSESPDLEKYMENFKIVYFFFNLDSVNTIPWSKIREKNIYKKRVILDTKQDLDSCNNKITYP